jgi:hypothetical protein
MQSLTQDEKNNLINYINEQYYNIFYMMPYVILRNNSIVVKLYSHNKYIKFYITKRGDDYVILY